ncbi:MAG: hypothetical protein ACPG4X_20585 [Pikeienuella sp.]
MADNDIWWGAYVGMSEEILIHGPLDEVAEDILATRAQARTDHGWTSISRKNTLCDTKRRKWRLRRRDVPG